MLGTLRDLATGRSWRSRATRGATVLSLGGAWLAPAFGILPPLAVWNTSDSVPAGLYLYAHHLSASALPKYGDYVALRDPPHFDLPLLLKRVEGVPGDRYCWNDAAGTHELNGRPMPPPDPDSVALGIPVWKGCVTLGYGQVVGYGRTPDSYDSRYFGPVATDRLWGVYRPLWVGP
jgi:type IV secretory pathway protease TraF